jgi:wyosine [tRNA(Phe)-imidazoG37] synthetase (radical SAM superfamily)
LNKEACPTIYGPVTSRRHGRSLGINLGNPIYKICTWGCVYCQCGVGERRAFSAGDGLPSVDEVLTDLTEALIRLQADGQKLDSVTFAGNTESF